jgi:predicted signal transduction protein with EAL and GGDEF domain
MYPEHGDNVCKLMKAADIAMYTSKESGKNRYEVYQNSMNVAFSDRMNLEKYLHVAMEKHEFELYYQPQLDLKNDKITGLEALLRWKSPELGNVSPMDFIKVAEDTHLIIPLGEWVLIQACEFLSQLHKSGYPNMAMSVNISPIQILQEDFADKVIKILKYFNIAPLCLELEIVGERVKIPDALVPADARVEIEAKIAAGYFTDGSVPTAEALAGVKGRQLDA